MKKTIAVIGAGPGVGMAVAERFGREGFQVALIARDAVKLNERVSQLQAMGITAAAFPADAADRDGLTRALQEAAEKLGGIDVLEYGPTPTADSLVSPRNINVENEQFHLDLAVLGAITAVRAVLPRLIAQRSGTILFTTAISALHPIARTSSFGVAAGAALNYARVLHQDLKPEGVHAGIVCIAGLVVQAAADPSTDDMFAGGKIPTVVAGDVADAHWRHHIGRAEPVTTIGDADAFHSMAMS